MKRKEYSTPEHGGGDGPELLRVEIIAGSTDKAGHTINARPLYWTGSASEDPWSTRDEVGIFVYTIDGEEPTVGDRVWAMWCPDACHWEQVTVASSTGKKAKCRFTLDAALTTSDVSKAATITDQYGRGTSHESMSITVYNLQTHTSGTYVFEGDSDDAGYAFYDEPNDKWYIDQMECP